MAAQSEAASVKGSPFSGRLLRAVLYSTSRWLASWSFLLSARFHGSTRCNLGSSLRNRGARGPAGKYSFNQLPIPDDGHAVHERSEEHTSELQSPDHLVCRLLLEKKNQTLYTAFIDTYTS